MSAHFATALRCGPHARGDHPEVRGNLYMIIVEGYGLTESTAGATANPIDGVRKIGSIGIPFAGTEI